MAVSVTLLEPSKDILPDKSPAKEIVLAVVKALAVIATLAKLATLADAAFVDVAEIPFVPIYRYPVIKITLAEVKAAGIVPPIKFNTPDT